MHIKLFKLTALALVLASAANASQQTLNPNQWRYAVDPHGSSASYQKPLVNPDHVAISFYRVPRVDKQNNSWVELIYDLPSKSLQGVNRLKVTYQSDKPLVIKLSQKDYGTDGDKSYAHFQTVLPSSTTWQTQSVALTQFVRPEWTPTWSSNKGINKENISALYFVPDLTDEQGGEATIKISDITLIQ